MRDFSVSSTHSYLSNLDNILTTAAWSLSLVSSDNDVTASGSPYLEFLNTSFSTDQDLSLPERVITPSPLLENANSPYSNTGRNGSNLSTTPRDRILNTLFKRGSKETLNTASSSSPRISNKPHATQRSNASSSVGALSQHQGAAMSEGSTGSLSPSLASSSPVPPKSILKSKLQGTQANALPPISYFTRPQQPQPSYPQDAHLQYLLSNNNNNDNNNNNNHSANNTYNNMNHNRVQSQSQPLHLQQQQHQQQQLYSQSLLPLSAPQPMFGSELGRSDSPSGRLGGGFDGTNTASLSSTHRSSRQLAGSGMDPNYNMTESDMTLEGLAERWQSYQALMRKRYAEEPFYKRWTKSKWMLLFSSLLMLGYSVAVLVVAVGYQSGRKLLFSSGMVVFVHGSVCKCCAAVNNAGILPLFFLSPSESTGFENAEVAAEFHGKIIHCKAPITCITLCPKDSVQSRPMNSPSRLNVYSFLCLSSGHGCLHHRNRDRRRGIVRHRAREPRVAVVVYVPAVASVCALRRRRLWGIQGHPVQPPRAPPQRVEQHVYPRTAPSCAEKRKTQLPSIQSIFGSILPPFMSTNQCCLVFLLRQIS